MRTLRVYNQVSLDGYICDRHGDMRWAHKADPEWLAFVAGNASGESEFVFGRLTYDLMASYWPTPAARQQNPALAERMNATPKVVFSRTLASAGWQNTRLITGDLADSTRALKQEPGPDLVIFGSGRLVAQLTALGLIDEYQVVLCPIVLGAGRTMFEGVDRTALRLTNSRTFGNGNVVLWYAPAR